MRPIVKWAGGKARLTGRILEHVPGEIRTYAEPFAGGAAVFLALAKERADGARSFQRAVLSDRNEELVACYRAVRDDVDALLGELAEYRYDRDMFYEVRERETRGMSDVQRGARLLYLNHTCFNGLWRVNSKGKFNVPFGRYTNPKFSNPTRLRAVSQLLAGVDVRNDDFADVTKRLREGDFVYLDPPYAPVSDTSDFTAYAKDGFGPDDQKRLADELVRLKARGVRAVLSNADTPTTRALYSSLRLQALDVRRSINADAKGRGMAAELLVFNWDEAPKKRRRAAR